MDTIEYYNSETQKTLTPRRQVQFLKLSFRLKKELYTGCIGLWIISVFGVPKNYKKSRLKLVKIGNI